MSPDDRYITEDKPVPDPHSVQRMLLVQEFTGIRCSNCPDAAAKLHELAQDHPGRIILVGMHAEGAGILTLPYGKFDLRCQEANVLYQHYRPSALPAALFNGTSLSIDRDSWATSVNDALNKETYMTIDLSTSYDPVSRKGKVDYRIDFTDNIARPLNVMIWLTEDNIVGPQIVGSSGLDTRYTHSHVLRGSMNGDWGTPIGDSFRNGSSSEGSASMDLADGWIAENCNAVVYVFDSETKEIYQSASLALCGSVDSE